MILYGDCLEELKNLNNENIDLVVTDPPYGIGFMGKDWDRALPDKRIWAECLRVLKPGAFAFVMSIPRADCLSRMIISLEDAGFRTNFTPIYWAYASGFPKAQNIGKAVDRRGGVSIGWFGKWLKEWRLEKGITQKEIAKLFPSKTGGLTGCVANWELGLNIPTPQEFTTICRHFNLPFGNIEEAEREVTGNGKSHVSGEGADNSWSSGYKLEYNKKDNPATPQAKALDGSYGGFQPKPAVEVIIVCMKPLSEKTFVDQALSNQKGITWLDDCRVPYESEGDKGDINRFPRAYSVEGSNEGWKRPSHDTYTKPIVGIKGGRFPANLLVSDDVLNDGRILISKWGRDCGRGDNEDWHGQKGLGHYTRADKYMGDSGSFSRYFDLDKWFKTFPFLIVPKASKSEKGGNNNHPTVKPLKLMSYLITLGSREGDTVLDPFIGSGTTAVACKMLKRNCIGIDISKEYCEIATKRVEAVAECQMILT